MAFSFVAQGAGRRFRLSLDQQCNLLTMLVRFANIFYMATAPLLWEQNAHLMKTTPIVGGASCALVLLVLAWPRLGPVVLTITWWVNILSGTLLIGLFGFSAGAPVALYYLFAVGLGLSLAGTELAALQLAVRHREENTLRKRISWFSATKAMGVGSGFLLGGLVAGTAWSAGPARVVVALSGLAMVALSLAMMARPHALSELPLQPEGPEGRAGASRAAILGAVFILVNFILVNTWMGVVPVRMGKEGALFKEGIGLLLAAESYCHALGNIVLQERIGRLGNGRSFAIGFAASLGLVALLLASPHWGSLGFLLLLGVLGLSNALTYLSSTTLFYSAGLPRGIFPRIAVHKLASSLGRAIGSWVALRILMGWST
jgi:hypothetical protein